MTADRENQVVAVERVKEYTDTQSEAPLYNDDNPPPPSVSDAALYLMSFFVLLYNHMSVFYLIL